MSSWEYPKENQLRILKTTWNHILIHFNHIVDHIYIKHKLGPLTSMYFFKMRYYTSNPTNRRTTYFQSWEKEPWNINTPTHNKNKSWATIDPSEKKIQQKETFSGFPAFQHILQCSIYKVLCNLISEFWFSLI